MKNFFNTKTAGKVLTIILSFLLSLFIAGGTLVTVLRFTVFNPMFFSDSLNNSSYYTDLCDEITNGLKDIGDASGLDKSFFEDFVKESLVREDVQDYIEKFYNGDKLAVNTETFEKDLRAALAKYERENSITMTEYSSESVDYFVSEAAKIYASNIRINYLSAIQKGFNKAAKALNIAAIVIGILIIGIIVFLFITAQWKHKALRRIYYAFCGAGLFIAGIPAIVFVSGFIGKIALLSKSLNDMYTAILNSLFLDMLISAAALIAVAVAAAVAHYVLRHKASE